MNRQNRYRKRITVTAYWSRDGADYKKPWGVQQFSSSHWVVIGIDGDIYGCDLAVFNATYELVEGHEGRYRKVGAVAASQLEAETIVNTLEGPARGVPGDWLVTNSTGEQYVISDSTFRATYELAEES
jgi:hypothetical protein